MPKEIFEVVRERFHLSDRTQYIVQGHWPKDAVMEAYLDQHKLKVSVKENENVSALERFKRSGENAGNTDYGNCSDTGKSGGVS